MKQRNNQHTDKNMDVKKCKLPFNSSDEAPREHRRHVDRLETRNVTRLTTKTKHTRQILDLKSQERSKTKKEHNREIMHIYVTLPGFVHDKTNKCCYQRFLGHQHVVVQHEK
jgi:hypothetical protein